jgi:hypothetical protein
VKRGHGEQARLGIGIKPSQSGTAGLRRGTEP